MTSRTFNTAESLHALWSKDFVVTNPNKFVNKQRAIGMITTGMRAFASYDRQIEYVQIYGDTAVVVSPRVIHHRQTEELQRGES